MTTRRGFLGAILAAGAAPLIVKAGVLMPIRDTRVLLWADGLHDDTAALQYWINGGDVRFHGGVGPGDELADRGFVTTKTIYLPELRLRRRSIDRCNFIYSGTDEYFLFSKNSSGEPLAFRDNVVQFEPPLKRMNYGLVIEGAA